MVFVISQPRVDTEEKRSTKFWIESEEKKKSLPLLTFVIVIYLIKQKPL